MGGGGGGGGQADQTNYSGDGGGSYWHVSVEVKFVPFKNKL